MACNRRPVPPLGNLILMMSLLLLLVLCLGCSGRAPRHASVPGAEALGPAQDDATPDDPQSRDPEKEIQAPASTPDPFADPPADAPETTDDDPFADPDEEDLSFLDELEAEETAAARLVADPLEPWNRMMFKVNDRLYFWLLKPVALGYRKVVPTPMRTGIRNFMYNLGMPVRLVNNLLQGRFKASGAELGRFFVNTTEGILGFGNPAGRYPELVIPEEDLGQTLGSYNFGNGIYLVWPFFGASSFRDTVGLVGDALMDPLSIFNVVDTGMWLGIKGVDTVNNVSFRIGDYETLLEVAMDPYDALLNGYIQRRNRQIQE